MKQLARPDWDVWRNVANLTTDEAAALTMNFCPHTIKEILGEVAYSGSPALFGLVASCKGMDFKEAEIFENRLLVLERGDGKTVPIAQLPSLAKQYGWSIPEELCLPTTSDIEGGRVAETLSDNERTKLLKQIGALALLLAEKTKLYAKGSTGVNASQIATAVVDHIAELPGRDGAGNSSLRTSIKTGIELLNK